MDREFNSLLAELEVLKDGLKLLGATEATMRLRALIELSECLGTEALLMLAASTCEDETDLRLAA